MHPQVDLRYKLRAHHRGVGSDGSLFGVAMTFAVAISEQLWLFVVDRSDAGSDVSSMFWINARMEEQQQRRCLLWMRVCVCACVFVCLRRMMEVVKVMGMMREQKGSPVFADVGVGGEHHLVTP